MTKITIHGQKMQYHKRVAISVSLSVSEGGTAKFTPATGTSYTLSSLPIGTRIVKSTDTLYPLSDANGNSVGTITLVASSGYNADEVSRTRGGIKTTIGIVPIILQEGDIIVAEFEAITMRIKLYNNGLGDFYNELTGQYISDGGYADVPRADVLEFKPYSTTNGIIEIYKDGLWIPVIDYTYNGQQAYILAAPASAQVQDIEFTPEPGTTYKFPAMWGLQDGYQYLDGSTFALQNSPVTCDLVDYKTAGWTSPTDKSSDIRNALQQIVSQYGQFQGFQAAAPSNLSYSYILYDGDRSCCGLAYGDLMYVYYDPQSGQAYNFNTSVIVAFFDAGSDLYATPYELSPSGQYQFLPQWSNTSLFDPRGYISQAFTYGDKNVLGNWMQDWNCGDVCELMQTIYILATNK